MKNILADYGLDADKCSILPYGSGLINHTWLVSVAGTTEQFILQQVNQEVFKVPADISFNIRLLSAYFKEQHPGYLFTDLLRTMNGDDLVHTSDRYFRMFPFVRNSHTIDVVQDPGMAFEAATQFGRFTRLLAGLPVEQLRITLPDFHNLPLRFSQFEHALQHGEPQRIKQSSELIGKAYANKVILDEYEYARKQFKSRCTHHDCKISNVLFDDTGKGLCVIDLDTVMPGYFISDVGDMMRTYLSPTNEEDSKYTGIEIRKAYYQAIFDGYLGEMGGELTGFEKKYFHFSGKFMIYMQSLRFLTDHLNNDIYYGTRYEGQNLVRASNQFTLLQRFMEFNHR